MLRIIWYLLQPFIVAITHYYTKEYISIRSFVVLLLVYWILMRIFAEQCLGKLEKHLRLKLKIDHESGLSGKEWRRRQEELARQQEEQRRVAELEALLESRHYTQAEIDSLIRTTQMGDEEKTRLRKKYLGKR